MRGIRAQSKHACVNSNKMSLWRDSVWARESPEPLTALRMDGGQERLSSISL